MRTRPHAAPSLFAATAAILAASMLASSPIAGAQAVNPSSNTTTIAAAPTVTAGQSSPSDRWTRLRQAPGTGALSVAFASPTGQLRTVRQASELRWVFDRPVIALGDIAKQPTADVMIEPALPGTLRWASTRVLILTPKVRARLSTRYAAALRWPGLASPKSTVFETPRVSCTLYSTADGWADVQRQSSILVTCTQPVDGADLAGRVTLHFTPNGPKAEMAADPEGKRRLSLVRAEAVRTTTFDRTGRCPESDPRQACHWLKVNGDIPLSSDGTVRFADGIKSTEGPLPSLRVAPSSVSVPAQPVVLATGCRSDCNPADGIPIEIHGAYDQEAFTGKVTRRDLASGVTVINDGDGSAFNGLASLRTYDIEVSPDLTDSTGHRLGYRSVFRFTTGRKRAYIAITNGESVLESARGRQLGLIRRNVVSYDLVNRPIAKADIVASIRLVRNPTPTTPNATNPYGRAGTITVPSTPDADRTDPLTVDGFGPHLIAARPVTTEAKSTYEPVAGGASWDSSTASLVQVTDLAVTVKQAPIMVALAVTSLSSGQPSGGVAVELWRIDSSTPIWSGRTDSGGFAWFRQPPCAAADPSCELIAIASTANDLAYTSSHWLLGGRPNPIDDFVREGAPQPRGALTTTPVASPLAAAESVRGLVFADRGVYKPGEEVHLHGVARISTPTGLRLPLGPGATPLPATLVVTDDRGAEVTRRDLVLDANGAFDTVFALPSDATQGYWSAQAQVAGMPISGSFLVTSFRRPDIKVDVIVDRPSYVAGDTLTGTVEGDYLFGAPMAGQAGHTTISTAATSIDPTEGHPELGLKGYRWDFACVSYPCGAEPSEVSADADVKLDAKGQIAVRTVLPVQRTRHSPYTVTVEGRATNVDRQVIANRTSTLVHEGEHYLGLKLDNGFGRVAQPLTAKVFAVTPDARVASPVTVTATLRRWTFPTDGSNPTSTDEATAQLGTAATPTTFQLTPKRPGEHELVVSSTDQRGNVIETSTLTWIVGPGEATWSRPDPNAVNLTPEKASYAPGETAQILVTTPWPNVATVPALVSVERETVMTMQRIIVTGGVAAISVPIPTDGAPNVSIAVTLFKPAAGNERPEAKAGSVELTVTPEAHHLSVSVRSDAATYRPGAAAVATVAVKSPSGAAAEGQVTLWAVDEGVLRLSGYTIPDLLGSLWAPRPVLVSTADPRLRLYEPPSPITEQDERNRSGRFNERGLAQPAPASKASGGLAADSASAAAEAPALTGGGDGPVPTLRTDFRVLAHWVGAEPVGANGTVSVPFTLPQSLTTYRILAVATSGADDFGGATSTLEIRQPFMVQPALPRFVTPGDTFEAGAVVQNQTGAPGRATLAMAIDGPLTIDGPATQTRTVTEGPTEFRFKLRATALGTVKLRLTATFSGATREADAVEAEIPVTRTQRLETVVAAGTVNAGSSATEQIAVPTNIEPDSGGLETTVSSSALAGLQTGVESLVQYPYGCLEQRSSRIRALLMLSDLKSTFPLNAIGQTDLRTVVINELARIPNYRTPDGGLGYWEGGTTADPYLTARVLGLLLDAERLGVPAPTDLRAGIVAYLTGALEPSPARYDSIWMSRASILEALARSGSPNNGLAARLYRQRWDLPIDQQIDLLRALVEGGDRSTKAPTLYGELLSSVRVEADQAFVQQDRSWDDIGVWAWYRFSDDTHLTASLLSVVAQVDPNGVLAGPMARWLLAQRGKDGAWANTYENASALTGLVDYARAAESDAGPLQATITAGAKPVLDATFTPRSLDIRSNSTPLSGVGSGALTVSATGTGRANYTVRLRYAPAIRSLRALDQGFSVTREYRTYAGQGQPATSFAAGDLVRVRITVKSTQARRQVVIDDPIPAGLEILNTNLASTSTAEATGTGVTSDPSAVSGGAYGIDHTEIRDDRVLLFASSLSPGTLVYDYVARATAPGHFVVAPAQAEEMYRPEIFGRNATAEIEVRG